MLSSSLEEMKTALVHRALCQYHVAKLTFDGFKSTPNRIKFDAERYEQALRYAEREVIQEVINSYNTWLENTTKRVKRADHGARKKE